MSNQTERCHRRVLLAEQRHWRKPCHLPGMASKEIQAAADQIVVAEGHVIHLRLQAQVASHSRRSRFGPSSNTSCMQFFRVRTATSSMAFNCGSAMTAGCGLPAEVTVSRAISSNCRRNLRDSADLHLQVAQAIATWQSDPGGQDVKPQILLLQPAAAQPSRYSLNGSQTSLSVSPKVKCRWAGASGGLPTLRQLNCR